MIKRRTTSQSATKFQYIIALGVFFVIAAIYLVTKLFPISFDLRSRAQSDVARQHTLSLIRATRTLKAAPAADRSRAQEALIDIAAKRQESMLALMESNTEEFLKIALPRTVKDEVPLALQSSVEEEITLEGELEALVADNFENDTSKNNYFLKSNGNRYELHFVDEGPISAANALVRVKGIRLANDIAVPSSSNRDVQILRNASDVLGANSDGKVLGATTKQVAIIAFNFTNDTRTPKTISELRTLVFTGNPSVKGFYNAASFGDVTIAGKLRTDGDIYGWYTIPYTNTGCDYGGTWTTAANNAAAANGFVATGYTNIVYVFPDTTQCGWGGMGQVGRSLSWINGWWGIISFAHEMGHNYNLSHSSSYACRDANGAYTAISGTCTVTNTYGDHYDTMGSSYSPTAMHFNNYHKSRINPVYFTEANMKTVTADGTFIIYPIEQAATGFQSLRIPRTISPTGAITDYYYVEFRQPDGVYDTTNAEYTVFNGVLIRIAPDYPVYQSSWLIDTTPDGSFKNAALLPGRTFTDPATGISITANSISTTQASVTVRTGTATCVRSNPTVTISPVGQWGQAGATLSYTVNVTNTDSPTCGSATFSVAGILPSGFTQNTPSTLTLNPGAVGSIPISITSASNTVEGIYGFSETVTNNQANTYRSVVTGSYNVLAPPAPPTPTPTSTPRPTATPTPSIPSPTPNTTDVTAPIITITSPTNNTQLPSNGSMRINSSASDGSGIYRIQIYLDSTLLKTCSSVTTCSVNISMQKISTGSHVIKATATDASANRNSATTQITVTK